MCRSVFAGDVGRSNIRYDYAILERITMAKIDAAARKNSQHSVSNVAAGFGWLIVGVFFLTGLIYGWKLGGFSTGIFFGIIFGVLLGIPFIVWGQLTSVFVDQKELLEEILDTVKKEKQS